VLGLGPTNDYDYNRDEEGPGKKGGQSSLYIILVFYLYFALPPEEVLLVLERS
jgi:hypothetical protein